jgi:hypothetical protein
LLCHVGELLLHLAEDLVHEIRKIFGLLLSILTDLI